MVGFFFSAGTQRIASIFKLFSKHLPALEVIFTVILYILCYIVLQYEVINISKRVKVTSFVPINSLFLPGALQKNRWQKKQKRQVGSVF